MSATHPIVLLSSSPAPLLPQGSVVWLELSPSPPGSPKIERLSSPLAHRVPPPVRPDLSALIPSTPPRSPKSPIPASPIALVFRLPRFTEDDILPAIPALYSAESDSGEEDGSLHQDEAEVDDLRPSDDDSSELSSVPGEECQDEPSSEEGSIHESDADFDLGDSEDISVASEDEEDKKLKVGDGEEDEEAEFTDGRSGSSEGGVDGEAEQREANKNPGGTWQMPRRKRKRTATAKEPTPASDSEDDTPIGDLIQNKRHLTTLTGPSFIAPP
ncbi:hypothetical protein CF326_g4048 [Tilletia indica]|nr:hypothetical protein CF326_g4048 [Tilletia indica]